MMLNTPRMFVGSTTFQVKISRGVLLLDAVRTAFRGFPGVRVVSVDPVGGLLTVVTDDPVDRAELDAAIAGTGCTVLLQRSDQITGASVEPGEITDTSRMSGLPR